MKKKIIDVLKLAVILSLMSLPIVAAFHTTNHKSARIRQVNGVGEKIIKDYDNEWKVLPFKVGDTISQYVLLIGKYSTDKDYIVIEVNN